MAELFLCNFSCMKDLHYTLFFVLFCFFRKGTLLINNIFALVAALLMGLSYPTGIYELLIVGRFFSGFNAGNSLEDAFKIITLHIWFHHGRSSIWNVIIFDFHRHWPLCPTSIFGWNRSNCNSWGHGDGNLSFPHWWDLSWTSGRPQVNTGHKTFSFHQHKWLGHFLCDFTESSWEEKSTGPSCSPPQVSQPFCSCWSCPGSQRALATCS